MRSFTEKRGINNRSQRIANPNQPRHRQQRQQSQQQQDFKPPSRSSHDIGNSNSRYNTIVTTSNHTSYRYHLNSRRSICSSCWCCDADRIQIQEGGNNRDEDLH
mmetsp:Transcript_9807/g.26744  ORF Transcript_9807/g.26744 Transcript_9807/m.26744 type:complete len:104 (-) Transcript_9807:3-314(-)